MVMHTPPNPIERTLRQASLWTVLNGIHASMGPLPEFRQARKRVAQGTHRDPTSPRYVLGTDPVRSRAKVEEMA